VTRRWLGLYGGVWGEGVRGAAAVAPLLTRPLPPNSPPKQADVAGLHYHLSPEGRHGIEARIDGFSHRLPALAGRVIAALAGPPGYDDATFATVREALLRRYRNMNMQARPRARACSWGALGVRPPLPAAASC